MRRSRVLGPVLGLVAVLLLVSGVGACTSSSNTDVAFEAPTGPGYGAPDSPLVAGLKTPTNSLRIGPVFPNGDGSSQAFLLVTGDPFTVMRSLVSQVSAAGYTPYSDAGRPICLITKGLSTYRSAVPLTDEASARAAHGSVLNCDLTAAKSSNQAGKEEHLKIGLSLGRVSGKAISQLVIAHSPVADFAVQSPLEGKEKPRYQVASYVPRSRSPIQPTKLDLARTGDRLGPALHSGGQFRVAKYSQLMAPPVLDEVVKPYSLQAVLRVADFARADEVFVAYARQVLNEAVLLSVDPAALVPSAVTEADLADGDIRITHSVDGGTKHRTAQFSGAGAGTAFLVLVADPRLGAYLMLERHAD